MLISLSERPRERPSERPYSEHSDFALSRLSSRFHEGEYSLNVAPQRTSSKETSLNVSAASWQVRVALRNTQALWSGTPVPLSYKFIWTPYRNSWKLLRSIQSLNFKHKHNGMRRLIKTLEPFAGTTDIGRLKSLRLGPSQVCSLNKQILFNRIGFTFESLELLLEDKDTNQNVGSEH